MVGVYSMIGKSDELKKKKKLRDEQRWADESCDSDCFDLSSSSATPVPVPLDLGRASKEVNEFVEEDRCRYYGCDDDGEDGDERCRSETVESGKLRQAGEFSGYQVSGNRKYQVKVVLSCVEFPDGSGELRRFGLARPHISGLLTIRGLASNYREITTQFEGYAVMSNEADADFRKCNYGLMSSNWSSHEHLQTYKCEDDAIDLEHWRNFASLDELEYSDNQLQEARFTKIGEYLDGSIGINPGNYLNNRFLFMRWKEVSMVAAKRQFYDSCETIDETLDNGVGGASFDGYYYIVHDQLKGDIKGFYYHSSSEKFQKLDLEPVSTRTNCNAFQSFEYA